MAYLVLRLNITSENEVLAEEMLSSKARTRSASRDSGVGDSQQSSQGDSAPQEEYAPAKKSRKTPRARPAQWVCIMPGLWAWFDADINM